MSMSKIENKPYTHVTKQAFKDECDINNILRRAQKTGTISHLAAHGAQYGDFADYDFFEHQQKLTKGREIFDALPSEIRNEFRNDQVSFFRYVNDPENADRLDELLPGLAAPGRQFIDVLNKPSPDGASEPPASETPPAEAPPKAPPVEAPTEPPTA